MKKVAEGLAALGRGPDTMLVHMSPREVGGLQALAMANGGSLTINPDTGLPEAGFLKDILPTVAAVGLTMMGVPAWGVGLGTGLTSKATGKSTQDSLMSGLLAGGGAGLFGPSQGAFTQMGEQAGAALTPNVGAAGFAPAEVAQLQAAGFPTTAEGINAVNYAAGDAAAGAGGSAGVAPQSYMERLAGGMKSAAADPMQFAKDNKYALGALGIGALGAAGGFDQPTLGPLGSTQQGSNARISKPWQEEIDPTAMGRTDRRIFTGDRYAGSYADGGGIMALAGGGYAGDYAAGGKLLDGPGDGVSDSIPAVIQGPKPQRAALADGEFVVPARIVSELGNGSTKAGAKRLYAMMDRVQNARGKTVGKNKVAVDTKPEKFLPA
jgi:hypothetical protein